MLLEELAKIRKNPRKMRLDFLSSNGYMDYINEHSPAEWKMSERIDYILSEFKFNCHCGKPAKTNSLWCSLSCRNKDSTIRKNISNKNSKNSKNRLTKARITLQQRYKVNHPQQIQAVKDKTRESKLKFEEECIRETFSNYNLNYDYYCNHEFLKTITKDSSYQELSDSHFNGMPPMTIWRHFSRINFNPNFNKSSSIGERSLADWISSLGVKVIRNDRFIISPKELDIVIPQHKLCIEYNGLYWHSNDKHSMNLKRKECLNLGYALLNIYEDEWLMKQDIVKSIVLSKMNMNRTLYARKCSIEKISNAKAREFLERSHIQGYAIGSHYALCYNDDIVCIMTIAKSRFTKNQYELVRFATSLNTTVVGGFSKLLKYCKTLIDGELISYSDNRLFSGHSYHKIGKYLGDSGLGYYWVDTKKNVRINRNRTQKHKLKTLLGNQFDESLSESENMEKAGYLKIWDCGNKKFLL